MAHVTKRAIMYGTSGGFGKQIVYRQLGDKTIASSYPDMSKVKRTRKQKAEQGLFAKAVEYARAISNDPKLKAEYAKQLKNGKRVYNAAIQEYLAKNKLAKG